MNSIAEQLTCERKKIKDEIANIKAQIVSLKDGSERSVALRADYEGRIRSLKKEFDKYSYYYFKMQHGETITQKVTSETVCEKCNKEMVFLGHDEYITCPVCSSTKLAPCGTCSVPIDTSEERARPGSQYRKVNYLDNWNDYLECKPWASIPDKVIDILRKEERNLLGGTIKGLPPIKIRDWLKKHKLKELYKNVPQLYCMLTNTEPIHLSRELKTRQKGIFLQFQAIWKEVFTEETNLSSYAVIVSKIYEHLGYPHYGDYFPKTKHVKVQENAEKKWEYIASKMGLIDRKIDIPRIDYYSKPKKKPRARQVARAL